MKRFYHVTLKLYEKGKPTDDTKSFGTIAETIDQAGLFVTTRWKQIDETDTDAGFEWKCVRVMMSDMDLIMPKGIDGLVSLPPDDE